MELKTLDWDSNFWGMKIFSLSLDEGDSIEKAEAHLKKMNADLAYIFLPVGSKFSLILDNRNDAILYDQKLTYSMNLENQISDSRFSEIIEYKGEPNDRFLQLSKLAGKHSRFFKDPNLCSKFEQLYEAWLRNSLNGKLADKVFTNEDFSGLVTCKITGKIGNIGLIATAAEKRGKGIGCQLVDSVHSWYKENEVIVSEVVTQRSNTIACSFYEKYGFAISKEELVYHWWFK